MAEVPSKYTIVVFNPIEAIRSGSPKSRSLEDKLRIKQQMIASHACLGTFCGEGGRNILHHHFFAICNCSSYPDSEIWPILREVHEEMTIPIDKFLASTRVNLLKLKTLKQIVHYAIRVCQNSPRGPNKCLCSYPLLKQHTLLALQEKLNCHSNNFCQAHIHHFLDPRDNTYLKDSIFRIVSQW